MDTYKEIDDFDAFALTDEEIHNAKNLAKNNDTDAVQRPKINVKTTIEKEKNNNSLKNNFVIAFTENFEALASLNINKTQFKIIAYILKKMDYGNLISISQTAIAKHLETDKSNISRNFKSLKQKNILVEDVDKNVFMNSNIFSKGLKNRLDKTKRDNLKKAQKQNEHFVDSFEI